ncbi:BPSL0067 family protein [Janthinobacterium sp. SUN118]|uniref:BPSL0067 family protein n=1 Tax=Janthinobacterium sp. SUN118 TaxID=3004100 RepID=UPI0025B04471|nr:BPSL0067 family protein [Janthinobacterium sp. SUN118]MDN2708419.1 BPSL0067 family protein [Janthinobacterium sp. SUN118]
MLKRCHDAHQYRAFLRVRIKTRARIWRMLAPSSTMGSNCMPYIARADYAKQKEVVGNGQCDTLVQHLAGARASSLWREGASVPDLLEKGRIAKGTVIATFVNGRYQHLPHGNHAALFIRQVPGGIEIFDQRRNHKPGTRVIHFGRSAAGPANRPERYAVVE